MSDDEIRLDKDHNLKSASGKDAVSVVKVDTIIRGIKMNIATNGKMQLTSTSKGGGIRNLLALASIYTNKKYTTGLKSKEQAIDDLTKWKNTMLAALPITVDK